MQNGSTPLYWAVNNGHEGIGKLLLEARADVDIQDKVRCLRARARLYEHTCTCWCSHTYVHTLTGVKVCMVSPTCVCARAPVDVVPARAVHVRRCAVYLSIIPKIPATHRRRPPRAPRAPALIRIPVHAKSQKCARAEKRPARDGDYMALLLPGGTSQGLGSSSKDDLSQVQYPRNTCPLLAAGLRTTPGVSL